MLGQILNSWQWQCHKDEWQATHALRLLLAYNLREGEKENGGMGQEGGRKGGGKERDGGRGGRGRGGRGKGREGGDGRKEGKRVEGERVREWQEPGREREVRRARWCQKRKSLTNLAVTCTTPKVVWVNASGVNAEIIRVITTGSRKPLSNSTSTRNITR